MTGAISKEVIHIQNAQVVRDNQIIIGDVLISEGKIKDIGEFTAPKDATLIDANRGFLIPGAIDLDFACVNLQSDTKKAVEGGVTTVGIKSDINIKSLNETVLKIDNQICCDAVIIPKIDSFLSLSDVETFVKNGMSCFQIDTVKNKLSDSTAEFISLLNSIRKQGALAMFEAVPSSFLMNKLYDRLHGACKDLGPEALLLAASGLSEANTILNISMHCQNYDFVTPFIINKIHSKEALKLITSLKHLPMFASTSVSAITAPFIYKNLEQADKSYEQEAKNLLNVISNPQIRLDKEFSEQLLTSLDTNVLDFVTSSHSGVNLEDKLKCFGKDFRTIPMGLNNVGSTLLLMSNICNNDKFISIYDIVNFTSTVPAKILNIYPQKGIISIGSDADLVLLKAMTDETVTANKGLDVVDVSKIDCVILGGRVVVRNGDIIESSAKPGLGNIVKADAFGAFVYDKVTEYETSECKSLHVVDRSVEQLPPTPEPEPEPKKEDVPKSTNKPVRTSVKTHQPPGGKSSIFF